jgi:hypothetical protein
MNSMKFPWRRDRLLTHDLISYGIIFAALILSHAIYYPLHDPQSPIIQFSSPHQHQNPYRKSTTSPFSRTGVAPSLSTLEETHVTTVINSQQVFSKTWLLSPLPSSPHLPHTILSPNPLLPLSPSRWSLEFVPIYDNGILLKWPLPGILLYSYIVTIQEKKYLQKVGFCTPTLSRRKG